MADGLLQDTEAEQVVGASPKGLAVSRGRWPSAGASWDSSREVMAMDGAPRQRVPIGQRRGDLVFVAFFLLNLLFITYMVDLEQLVIADPRHFTYPPWPPAPLVDLVHWYGAHYDPLLMARPPFWRMTIWIDVLGFGPFYAAAVYAFLRGRDWIRVPALVWSGLMTANVLIILMEERYGTWATPRFGAVLALNLPWLLLPSAVIWRMRRDHPFTAPAIAAPAARAVVP